MNVVVSNQFRTSIKFDVLNYIAECPTFVNGVLKGLIVSFSIAMISDTYWRPI